MTNLDILLADARRVCEKVNLRGLEGAQVLITGASGLIGTAMLASLAALHEAGIKTRVMTQVYSEPSNEMWKLVKLIDGRLIRMNLADARACGGLSGADIIIHAAGYGQPGLFMADPLTALRLNTVATDTLLQKLSPKGQLLFTSSTEVYQGLDKAELTENDIGTTDPAHPRACYIEGKRTGETMCHAWRAKGGRAVAARLAHTYGPGTRKHDQRAMNVFIEKALTTRQIPMRDAGAAVRTYGYIADTAAALWNILLSGKETVYNISGRSTTTIRALAEAIAAKTGAKVQLPEVADSVAGAPKEVRVSVARYENEFGSLARTELDEGLERTIAWQRNLYCA
ncbi:MAG: NAD(P)-dependent oxidoreductase [Verrucomicrobiota bacterium]